MILGQEDIYEKELREKIDRYYKALEYIEEEEQQLEAGEHLEGNLSYVSGAESCVRAARIMLYLNKIDKYIECVNRAADYGYFQIKYFGNDTSYNGITGRQSAFRVLLPSALLTQKREKILKYAEFIKEEPLGKIGYCIYEYNFIQGLMFRDLILGNEKSAKKIFKEFSRVGKREKPSLIPIFKSIINQDRVAIIEAIEGIVQYTIRTYKRQYDVPISLRGIYFILLSVYCGIDIDIKKDLGEKYQRFLPEDGFIGNGKKGFKGSSRVKGWP